MKNRNIIITIITGSITVTNIITTNIIIHHHHQSRHQYRLHANITNQDQQRLAFAIIRNCNRSIITNKCHHFLIQTGSFDDKYFKFPSKEEHFKDIITTDDWQDDKVFVEQRLAGMNPMSLRKLSAEGRKIKQDCLKFCKQKTTQFIISCIHV